MIFIGVDQSITSPAWTIYDKEKNVIKTFSFSNSMKKFSTLQSQLTEKQLTVKNQYTNNKRKKYYETKYEIINYLYPNNSIFDNNIKKYSTLSDYIVKSIIENCYYRYDSIIIYQENYSYGSKGKIIDLAECNGIVKYKIIRKLNINNIILCSPSEWKKANNLKGNCTKMDIVNKYILETDINLFELFGFKKDNYKNKKNIPSPITDITDSYFIAKYCYKKEKGTSF